MHKRAIVVALMIFTLGGSASFVLAAEETTPPPATETAPDNTGRNVRDRSGATLTPGDQSETKADRTLTQRIRKAVVKDKSLSTTAHNIKIITNNGTVTLRGPVKTEHERDKIVAKAQQIAGAKHVDNQLEVTHD
jgi:hyperosmotically inducible protein